MLLLFQFLLFISLVHSQCYFRNGTAKPSWYKPCGSSTKHGMCCRTGNENPDTCLQDDEHFGLCKNGAQTWREACTDPLWESEGCLKLCVEGIVQTDRGPTDMTETDVNLRICDDGSICCGVLDDARECCANKQGKWVFKGKVYSTNPASSIRPQTSTSSASPTAGTQPSAAPSSKTSTGTIVGSVIGGVGGIAIISGLVWFLLRRRKPATEYEHKGGGLEDEKRPHIVPSNQGNMPLRAESESQVSELATQGDSRELSAGLQSSQGRLKRPMSELPA